MTNKELRTVVLRVNVYGFIIAVPFFLVLVTLSLLVAFEFDARMMAWYGFAVAVSCVVLLPPTFIYLYTGFKRIGEAYERTLEEDSRPGVTRSSDLRRMETYPTKMAVVAVLVGTVGGTVGTLFYYYLGEYNGVLCVYYQLLIITFAFTTAYLEYHILYRFLEPLRRDVYTRLGTEGASGGYSLRTRILMLAAVFTLVPLAIGWIASVTRTSFFVADQVARTCSDNTELLADGIAVEVVSEDAPGVQGRLEAFSAGPDSSFIILDRQGAVVGTYDPAGRLNAEERDQVLKDLEASDSGSVTNRRMTLTAAGAPIGETGYTLVQVVPIDMLGGEVRNITLLYLLIASIVILVALLLIWLTYHSIAGPIIELGQVAAKVSEGDLTVHPSISSSDETGKLSEMVSHMVDNLREVSVETMEAAGHASEGATGVSATAEEIQASLSQLTSIIMQLAKNAEVEAATADKVNELTTEILAALQQSSDQAESGVELSQTSSNLAETGRNDAMNAIERMSQARDSILSTAGIIEDLGERSGEIGVIIEIIDGISDQTNLLALNAAIEAARAQEYGRGFSVVADEVRKLAEESSASTNRISGLVREIQKLAAEAVSSTHRGTEEVAQSMDAVQVAGESLQKIYDFVQRSEQLSHAISKTAQRHLELGEKVMEAVQEIHSIADGNASSSEEISASAEEQTASMQELTSTSMELVALSERLRRLVERFKV